MNNKFEMPQALPDPITDAQSAIAHMGAGNLMGNIKDGLFGSTANPGARGLEKLNPAQAMLQKYHKHVAKGKKAIESGVKHLYEGSFDSTSNDHEPLRKFMEGGGLDTQFQNTQSNPNQQDVLGDHHPEQNILLNEAKGNVFNYLNSLRPQPPQHLPFDDPPKNPEAERTYMAAVKLASNPLDILKDIKKGRLTPETMKNFTGMYPDLYNHLSKKMTEHLTAQQLNGATKPSYKVRQAMSLFLGSSLDTTLTPQMMTAAQGVFAAQKAAAPQPQPSKGKKEMAKKSSSADMTLDQARLSRQQTGK